MLQNGGEPLVIEESTAKNLRTALIPIALATAFLAVGFVKQGPIALLAVIIFIPSIGPSLWRLHLSRTAPRHSLIDAEGIHWSSGLDLPWKAVTEVRVGHDFDGIRPVRRLHLRPNMVSFVTATEAHFAARAKIKPTGQVLVTRTLTVSAEQIVTAVHRFSDVPVSQR